MQFDPEKIKSYLSKLNKIEELAEKLEHRYAGHLNKVDERYKKSAINLLHYMALGQFDIRLLQDELSSMGISSLKNAEPHTLENIHAVKKILNRVVNSDFDPVKNEPVTFQEGNDLLARNCDALLGGKSPGRDPHIMVTFPSAAAQNYELVYNMIQSGMECARINCAKDDEETWMRMIINIKKARKALNKPCKILMDLGGPKIRTGTIHEDYVDNLILKSGDKLIIHRDKTPGEPAKYNSDGTLAAPAHISCTFPGIFKDVNKGDRIYIDDGAIAGFITEANPDEMHVKISHAKNEKTKLRSMKGINFPDSHLKVEGLTEKDKNDLAFVAEHADIVNLSFVKKPEDVDLLLEELKQYNTENLGVLLKIETRQGVENLPWIILSAMKYYPIGVMIARGDLAIECGWVQLARIQEELLWICEAAHIPVVYATQVLEEMAKKGMPKRSEIIDAAMSQRADCVMLNKGKYIIEAITMLDEILKGMKDQSKKTSLLLKNLNLDA